MAGKLKPRDVERETRPSKYSDGDGLYLVVASATSKNWNYRYWNGKQRWLGLGSLKDVPLKDGRLARDAARLRVKGDRSIPGVDIVQEKRAARVEIKITLPTFEECATIEVQGGLIQTHPGLSPGSPRTCPLMVCLPIAKADSVGHPAGGQ